MVIRHYAIAPPPRTLARRTQLSAGVLFPYDWPPPPFPVISPRKRIGLVCHLPFPVILFRRRTDGPPFSLGRRSEVPVSHPPPTPPPPPPPPPTSPPPTSDRQALPTSGGGRRRIQPFRASLSQDQFFFVSASDPLIATTTSPGFVRAGPLTGQNTLPFRLVSSAESQNRIEARAPLHIATRLSPSWFGIGVPRAIREFPQREALSSPGAHEPSPFLRRHRSSFER